MFTKGNLYERLKSLFSFDLPNNIQLNTQEEEDEKIENKLLVCDVSKKRAQQLDELNRAFKSLENSNGLENVEKGTKLSV